MDEGQWAILAVAALLIDFAFGLALGYQWRASTEKSGGKPARDWSDLILCRINDLLAEVRGVVSCADDHVGRISEVRKTIDAASSKSAPPDFSPIAAAMEQLAGEMISIQRRLQERFVTTQQAANVVRRACSGGVLAVERSSGAGASQPGETANGQPHEVTTPVAPDREFAGEGGVSAAEPLTRPDLDAPHESRREDRHPYRAPQQVACYFPGRIPQPEEFQNVTCLDLSSGGVSFLTVEPPRTELIVITIGQGDNIVYRTARVTHRLEIMGAAVPTFRVGCQFIGRLSPHLF